MSSTNRENGQEKRTAMQMKAIDEFLAEVGKYPNMWNSMQLKAVAAWKGESLYLLGLRGALSENVDFSSEVLFETPHIIIIMETKKIRELPQLLCGLVQGEISMGNKVLKVDGPVRFGCAKFAAGKGLGDTQYPYMLLQGIGKMTHEIVDEQEINRSLLSWGYQGLDLLTEEKTDFAVGGSYSTNFGIVAPILLHADASFVNDSLRLAVSWHQSLRAGDIRASYEVSFGKAGSQRGTFDLLGAIPGEEEVTYSVQVEAKLPREAQSATIWVLHQSQKDPLYSLHVAKEPSAVTSPIWTAFRTVLSKREGGQVRSPDEIIEGVLGFTGEITDLGRFESAIHNLLACCGYICLFTGREWSAPGIDTLAFSPSSRKLLAISVTTSSDVREKVRTLLRRLKRLKDEMRGFQVVGAVFAPVEPDQVLAGDKRDAESAEIRLVLLPQLRRIWETLRKGPGSDAETLLDSLCFGDRPGY